MQKTQQTGFTLLEVIVAMAITGFVLGGLFALVGGSKQLSWRSEASLLQATRLRAASSFALLQDEYSDVEPVLDDDSFQIQAVELLEPPERKTEASVYQLEAYAITFPEREQTLEGKRWIRLQLPE
jgi:prepilin-type N-terminal cleavage/methylation domain-containing protein